MVVNHMNSTRRYVLHSWCVTKVIVHISLRFVVGFLDQVMSGYFRLFHLATRYVVTHGTSEY